MSIPSRLVMTLFSSVLLAVGIPTSEVVSAAVWWNPPGATMHFPELELTEIKEKKNTGISFSGGGSRSFVVSMAQLLALHELGLLGDTRYVTGVSGGNWAAALYSYRSPNISDDTLLGTWSRPSEITIEELSKIPAGCARGSALSEMWATVFEAFVHGKNMGVAWIDLIWQNYLKPYGISGNASFAYPNITDKYGYEYASYNTSRPYPILSITTLGPDSLAPFPDPRLAYTSLEATPLYVGEAVTQNVTFYHERILRKDDTEVVTIGGFIEPFAFGGDVQPGYDPYAQPPLAMRMRLEHAFTLKDAVGLSSMEPAGFVSTHTPFSDAWLPRYTYVSPGDSSVRSQRFLFGDGGSVENVRLTGLIQRKVASIVLFFNFQTPLKPSSSFDPSTSYESDDLDEQLGYFFGVKPKDRKNVEHRLRDQVFPQSAFAPTVKALQQAQATGRGAVTTTPLETVENTWLGIEAGFRCNVTWVYLTRASQWEAELSEEMRDLVVPKDNPDDPSSLRANGPFKRFPNFNTYETLVQTAEQANLLSDLSAWVIHANKDLFVKALS